MNFEQLLLELQTNPDKNKIDAITGQLSPSNAESLIQHAMQTSDKQFKLTLLRIITSTSLPSLQQKLIEAFGAEKDPDAKLLLSVSLGKCGNKKIISSLIELVKSKNHLMRMKAIISLQLIGNVALNELLIIMFKNIETNPTFAELMSNIICRIPGKDISNFEKIKTIKKPLVAKLFGSLDDPKAVSILISFLDEKNYLLSQAVTDALIFMGPKYANILGDFLTLNNTEYNYWLPKALVEMGKVGLDHLYGQLNTSNTELFKNLINIIPYDPNDILKKCLIENLQNGDVDVKEVISEKVIASEDTHLIYECKNLVYKKVDFNTKYFIMKILKKTGKADDLIKEFLLYTTSEKIIVPMVLSDYAEKDDFNMLINLSGDEDPFTSQLAVNGLHRIASECFEDIMEYSISDNNNIRRVCIALLKKLGDETEKRIQEFLVSGNQTQKFHAAYLTGVLYLTNCTDSLESLKNDGNDWVRKYSKQSLVRLKGPDMFVKFMRSEDDEEKKIAIDLLKEDFNAYCSFVFREWQKLSAETQESIKKAIMDISKTNSNIVDELKKYVSNLDASLIIESLIKQIELERSFG